MRCIFSIQRALRHFFIVKSSVNHLIFAFYFRYYLLMIRNANSKPREYKEPNTCPKVNINTAWIFILRISLKWNCKINTSWMISDLQKMCIKHKTTHGNKPVLVGLFHNLYRICSNVSITVHTNKWIHWKEKYMNM